MIWVLLCLTMQQLPINNSFIDKRLTKRWEVFGDSLKKAVEMHIPLNNSLEKLNIIVMGKSGAGKSTLINNVFCEKVTETGYGQPITDKIFQIKKQNSPLTIYDTPGLELDSNQQKSLLKQFAKIVKDSSKSEDMNDHIHCIWYCLNCRTSRFENAEIKFIKKIANDFNDKIPVILILTQCYNNMDKERMMQKIEKENLNIIIVPVVAEDYHMDINGLGVSVLVPSFGLEDLVDKMALGMPEIVQNVFFNVQKVSLKHKRHSAYLTVLETSIASSIIAGTPSPIGKFTLLIKTEKRMIKNINNIYFDQNDQNTLISFLNDTMMFFLLDNAAKFLIKASNTQNIKSKSFDVVFSSLSTGGPIPAGCTAAITTIIGITCIQFAEYKYKNAHTFNSMSKQQFENYFHELYNKNIIEVKNDPMKMLDDWNNKAIYNLNLNKKSNQY